MGRADRLEASQVSIRFVAIGLDHRHIWDLVGELLAAGAAGAGAARSSADGACLPGLAGGAGVQARPGAAANKHTPSARAAVRNWREDFILGTEGTASPRIAALATRRLPARLPGFGNCPVEILLNSRRAG